MSRVVTVKLSGETIFTSRPIKKPEKDWTEDGDLSILQDNGTEEYISEPDHDKYPVNKAGHNKLP